MNVHRVFHNTLVDMGLDFEGKAFFRIYLVLFIILSEKCQSHVGHFQARQQLGDPYLCVKLPLAWSLVLTA